MAPRTVPADIDDRIRPSGLRRIGDLVAVLPDSFDYKSAQAHQRSVTATIEFPADGVQDQLTALETMLQAVTVTPTLYRNLVKARHLLQEALEAALSHGEPHHLDVAAIVDFLGEETAGG